MGLVSCKENIEGQSHTLSKTDSTYTRVFRIVTDDPEDRGQTVRGYLASSEGIVYGIPYAAGNDSDPTSRVKTISPSPASDDGRHWDVTVTYGKFDTDSTTDNPLNEPAKISWSGAHYELPFDVDVEGNAVVSSSGTPFAEPLTRDDSRPVLSITRNEASFSPTLAQQYRDTVNADTFFGAEKGTVKCANISGDDFYHEGTQLWSVKYEFHHNPDGWKAKVFDASLMKIENDELVYITVKGERVSEPQFLDGSGDVLPKGEEPIVKEFAAYTELPFGTFGLG